MSRVFFFFEIKKNGIFAFFLTIRAFRRADNPQTVQKLELTATVQQRPGASCISIFSQCGHPIDSKTHHPVERHNGSYNTLFYLSASRAFAAVFSRLACTRERNDLLSAPELPSPSPVF